MAAACAAQGFAADYRAPDHPLQQAALALLRERSDGAVTGTVTDGCGVPCFVLPLSAMAKTWARLAQSVAQSARTPLGAIGAAMAAHPILTSGTRAFEVYLAGQAGIIAKVGAQGLLCLALPRLGLGVALRARSGSELVRPAAALAVLARLLPGQLAGEPPEQYTTVFNLVGQRVGEYAAQWVG
jgi:L-asparaginase II